MSKTDLACIAPQLRALAVPLSTLYPDPANVRLHGPRNVEAIKASLVQFGQRTPVVVRKDTMTVVAGNGRLEAARALGWTHIAANVQEMSLAEATAYAIADNRTAELAAWDDEGLELALRGLGEEPDLLAATGFDDEDLAALFANDEDAEPEVPDDDDYREQFAVMVLCRDESHQAEVSEQLKAGGHECKVVTT